MQRCTALTHRTKGISAPAIAARQRVRTRAAEAFDSGLAGAVAFGLGSIGIIAGTAFAGLYNVEKQARETVERKLERTQVRYPATLQQPSADCTAESKIPERPARLASCIAGRASKEGKPRQALKRGAARSPGGRCFAVSAAALICRCL